MCSPSICAAFSEARVRERRVVVRSTPLRPVVEPLGLLDREVVYRGVSRLHQSVLVELPVLVTIGSKPLAIGGVVLVREAHRDAVVAVRPVLLDEPVLEFLGPLALQELPYFFSALEDLRAIAPPRVFRIGHWDLRRISIVPSVLRGSDLL